MATQQQVPQGQPLELAPRGNMALTLADSFLNDLDELEEDNDEEEQEQTNEELANDLEESDDDVMADLKDEGVDAKIKLQSSERYRRHMTAIAERSEKPASFDDDEEYSLIVESNEILVKMDAELHEVHAYVNDLYGKKFPELETLVPSKLEYLRVVAQMGNEMDMTQVRNQCGKLQAPFNVVVFASTASESVVEPSTPSTRRVPHFSPSESGRVSYLGTAALVSAEIRTRSPRDTLERVERVTHGSRSPQVDLSGILPPTVVMVVSVTGSTTSGQPLTDSELGECLRGCDACLKLEDDKGTILQYLQSRMSMLAPNLTHLVGPSLAALLVGMAGGLADLARVPACNMTVMGQEKRYLGGFGMVAGMPHTGRSPRFEV